MIYYQLIVLKVEPINCQGTIQQQALEFGVSIFQSSMCNLSAAPFENHNHDPMTDAKWKIVSNLYHFQGSQTLQNRRFWFSLLNLEPKPSFGVSSGNMNFFAEPRLGPILVPFLVFQTITCTKEDTTETEQWNSCNVN